MDLLWILLYYLSVVYQIRYFLSKSTKTTAGVRINGIGIREVNPAFYVDRPGTGDYLFMLFHDAVCFGPDRKAIPAGSMVLWEKGVPHHYGLTTGRWSHSWVHCDGPEIPAILRRAKIGLNRPIVLNDPFRVDDALYNIHEELSVPKPDGFIIRNTLENLVRETARRNGGRERRQTPKGLEASQQLINLRYHEPLTLEKLASVAGLSKAHFCNEFRKHFGMPPITFLIQRRLTVAASLLHGTNLKVGEIGRLVGYDDPFYFSKHFKVRLGFSPLEYRNGANLLQAGAGPRIGKWA
jgi:AraC family transcriptional regulator of arabinose operon